MQRTFQTLPGDSVKFDDIEKEILEFWRQNNCFKRSLELSEGLKEFRFLDGPPFATGLPHYGHLLAGSLKDAVTRYAHQTGHHVPRAFGWDCHGLPVEYEIDQLLGVTNRDDIIHKIGIANYNEKCRSIVMKYSREWETVVERLGRWIDFETGYKTMNFTFMESVWWVFGQLFSKGLVYKDYKVMPYSTKCATPLSNFEAGENYKDVSDPSVIIAFPIRPYEKIDHPIPERNHDPEILNLVPSEILNKSEILAWTTTPWTLPANMTLTMSPTLKYSCFRVLDTQRLFWVADDRAEFILKDLKLITKQPPPSSASGGKKKDANVAKPDTTPAPLYEWVVRGISGSAFAELCYDPPFTTFSRSKDLWPRAWRVVCDDYITADAGTGTVHCAPCYGEDDYRVTLLNGIVVKKGAIPLHVDENGCLDAKVMEEEELKGVYVKTADKIIRQILKKKNRLVFDGSIIHSYPHCWRSDTPLIYRAVPSWFVAVTNIKDVLLESNLKTSWVPPAVQEKRFHNWLTDARDWCISRNRFWGTPIPLWISADGEQIRCISSVKELQEATGCEIPITDIHRHFIDNLTIPDPRSDGSPEAEKLYPPMKRIDEVFDCWFESGSMPYASVHYPFEKDSEKFKETYPADFVGEGLDQTRGWFYTLSVLGCALFGEAPFKHLIVNGLVLAEDGKKMSKRLKNYPAPQEVFESFGADALRIYMISSPALKAESLRFKKDGLKDIMKNILLPWYHSLRFLCQEVTRFETSNSSGKFQSIFSTENGDASDSDLNDMDRWIISMVNSLAAYIHQEMTAYRLYSACNNLLRFMDQLTNWYVRLNRERMRASSDSEEGEEGSRKHAQISLSVLHHVLINLTILLAPFTPFMSEFAFRELTKIKGAPLQLVIGPGKQLRPDEPLSVHYYRLPEADAKAIDPILEQRVADLQKIIILGRLLRDRKHLTIKQCVAELTVRSSNPSLIESLQSPGSSAYIKRELNCLKFSAVLDKDSVKLSCNPNLKVLGQKVGSKLKELQPFIRALTDEQLKEFMRTQTITVLDVELGAEDLLIVRTPVGVEETENLAVECGPDFLLSMDTRMTDELRALNLARDVTTKIQKLRKECGLQFDDNANETFVLENDDVVREQLVAVNELMQSMIKRKIRICKEWPSDRKILGRSQNITIFAD